MKFSLGGKIAFGFGTALLALVVISWVSYRETMSLVDSIRLAAHSHDVVDHLEEVLSCLKDAETGIRDFLITADRRDLEPFQAAKAVIPQRLNELKHVTASDPDRQKELEPLHALVVRKLTLLAEIVESRPLRGNTTAARLVKMEEGTKVMDEIRTLIGEMDRKEKTFMSRQSGTVGTLADAAGRVILLGGVIAFIFVALASALISRDIKERLGWRTI